MEKVKAVERYLNGETSLCEAANSISVEKTSIRRWVLIYQAEDPA